MASHDDEYPGDPADAPIAAGAAADTARRLAARDAGPLSFEGRTIREILGALGRRFAIGVSVEGEVPRLDARVPQLEADDLKADQALLLLASLAGGGAEIRDGEFVVVARD